MIPAIGRGSDCGTRLGPYEVILTSRFTPESQGVIIDGANVGVRVPSDVFASAGPLRDELANRLRLRARRSGKSSDRHDERDDDRYTADE
jgi:hypothetical protein